MNLQEICDKGVEEFKSKNYSQAINLFNQLPPDPSIKFFTAQAQWMMGQYSKAIENFQLAVELNPNEAQLSIALIKSLIAEYKYDQALDLVNQNLHRRPDIAFFSLYSLLLSNENIKDYDPSNLNRLFQRFSTDPLVANLQYAIAAFSNQKSDIVRVDDITKRSIESIQKRSKNIQMLSLPKDVLKHALNSVSIDGLYLEMGVFFGQSINISATIKPEKTFYGFDSFNGLPEDWKEGELEGSYSTKNQLPKVKPNVKLIKGWFKDTVPAFMKEKGDSIAFLHIDCDIYSSTKDVFDHCKSHLVEGSVILFDDFFGYQGFENHEMKAFDEFIQSSGFKVEYLAFCPMGRELAIKLK